MKKYKRYSDYDDFAWMYNKHWETRFTPFALAVLDEIVLPEIPRDANILDLCCGTGQLARMLYERGYRVTGIDGSGEMLRFARENAPAVKFVQEDARNFDLPPSFNLVTAFFDSLNHIMTVEELTAVFRNTYSCLEERGVFIFDLNMEPGYLKNWRGYYGIIEDDHVCLFPQSYDPESRVARFSATIFRLKDTWYRSDVELIQKCYAEDEIREALTGTGFTITDAFSYSIQSGRQELDEDSERAFFLCRKTA